MPRRSSTLAVSSAALNTLTLGTLTRIVPRATVAQVLRRHQRMHKIHCKLPAPFLVYFVIALGLQMALPTREVLRWLRQGMRALWGAAAVPAAMAGKAAISMARTRLGWEVPRDLYAACVRPLATRRTCAARQADEDPDRLSFTHTVRVLRRTLPQAAALPPSAVVALVSGRPD